MITDIVAILKIYGELYNLEYKKPRKTGALQLCQNAIFNHTLPPFFSLLVFIFYSPSVIASIKTFLPGNGYVS